jgi:alpha-beta hydrolase superfamily lysophospholipase
LTHRFLAALAAALASLVTLVLVIWVYRAVDARAMDPLQPWHRYLPANEFHASDHPDGITLADYFALEERLAVEIDRNFREALGPAERGPLNRYDESSLSYPGDDADRWNRSYRLLPDGEPVGGIVLLHGASDSPYSLRALARAFAEDGLIVLALRLPGNGTVPGGLTDVRLEDWTAVARMGMRHLSDQLGPSRPVYIGGYSIGAALAMDYALAAVEEEGGLRRPAGVFLYSPAIAVTPFARFASWDLLLSRLPMFRQFAWMSVEPEYDPYKYNSFPKNVGDISYRVTASIHERVERLSGQSGWERMSPVIAFQSLVDATVNTEALVDNIFGRLPDNGSELVLFDMNRNTLLEKMLKDSEADLLDGLLGGAATDFRLTIVRNQGQDTEAVAAYTRERGATAWSADDLGLRWPNGVYSLSHVAIPFSPHDSWYGAPDRREDPAPIAFSGIDPRGEKDVLKPDLATLMRLRYNPFFDYVQERSVAFRGRHP